MYNVLTPTYHRDPRSADYWLVTWRIIGKADSMAHAKAQGFVNPVLENT